MAYKIYDQVSTGQTTGSVSCHYFKCVQSFRPRFYYLEFVEMEVGHYPPKGPMDSYLKIRLGSLGGSVIGRSDILSLRARDYGKNPKTYIFSNPANLKVGELHFIEFVPIDPPSTGINSSWTTFRSGYTRGKMYVNGNSRDYDDFWFKTGVFDKRPRP